MASNETLARAAVSSALWFGVAYAVSLAAGLNAPLQEIATDAALMGGSTVVSGVLLNVTGMQNSSLSSALATGAVYTGAQAAWRGDDSYLINFLSATANDYLTETVGVAVWNSATGSA